MLVCARSCTLRGLNYSSVTATRRLARTRFMPFEQLSSSCRVSVSRHRVSYRASSQLSSIESALSSIEAIEHRVDRLANTVKPRWHSRRRHGASHCSYTQASHHSEAAQILLFGHSKETTRRGHTNILTQPTTASGIRARAFAAVCDHAYGRPARILNTPYSRLTLARSSCWRGMHTPV